MSEDRKEVVVCGDGEGLHHEVFVGSHRLAADEPPESGGSDRGPNPYDLLLASLGALHGDDPHDVCPKERFAPRGRHNSASTLEGPRRRLRRV